MSRKIKVLQLQVNSTASAAYLAEQLIQGLPTERFEVTAGFLRTELGAAEPQTCAARTINFNFAQSTPKGLRLRAAWRLYRLCREQRFDVVIAHRFKPMHLLMLVNLFLKVPACIGVQHGIGDFDRAYRRWESRLMLRANWRVVGVSRAVKDYLLGCGGGFTPANILQINNAIDIDRAESMQLSRKEARSQLGLDSQSFVFGTIGRLVPVKGHAHLIEAFAQVAGDHPRAQLVIIGEGRSRSQLESAITRHALQERVILAGALAGALQYVRAFDTFVMPSRSEGLPLALLEGMSGHLPVIGSDIDSLRPILEDCGGRMFSVGQPTALANCLRELLSLEQIVLAAEGERTYRYLRQAHGIDDFRRHYHQLIEAMLKETGND